MWIQNIRIYLTLLGHCLCPNFARNFLFFSRESLLKYFWDFRIFSKILTRILSKGCLENLWSNIYDYFSRKFRGIPVEFFSRCTFGNPFKGLFGFYFWKIFWDLGISKMFFFKLLWEFFFNLWLNFLLKLVRSSFNSSFGNSTDSRITSSWICPIALPGVSMSYFGNFFRISFRNFYTDFFCNYWRRFFWKFLLFRNP